MIPIANHVVTQQLKATGETVLIDREQRHLCVLNEVGAVIWQLVDGQRSSDEIVDLLQARFTIDRGQIAADVERFFSDLCARNIIALK